jgi:multidrug efflux pump subunit AcrA (membrane-fusion protein)
MKLLGPIRAFLTSTAGRATSISIVALGLAGAATLWLVDATPTREALAATDTAGPDVAAELAATHRDAIPIASDKLDSIGVRTVAARREAWPVRLRVTGRLELNHSEVAHVSSLVEGVVREVPVELGQVVEAGDVLAYIDSREVGEAKLKLVRDRLQHGLTERTHQWHQTVLQNTTALLDALDEERSLADIGASFRGRAVGSYRGQLISALAQLQHARTDFERIRSLAEDGVVPEKRLSEVRARRDSAEAAYRALVEQVRFDARQQAQASGQRLHEAEAAVAVSRSHLLILGYRAEDIDTMDPIAEAERIAYYPVRSPIAGTVIAKEAPLSKHVDRATELVEVADLSTVWLRADVFEKDLGAVRGLHGKQVSFRTNSYPSERFTAKVFSVGDVVDDETRAARLLAVADNTQRRLKPGMFVEIELSPGDDPSVLQLPPSAIQRHDGATFVFVAEGATDSRRAGADDSRRAGADDFRRRDVRVGRSTPEQVEIVDGLEEGEAVVVHGGFALKSEMLSELMAEE